MVYVRRSLDPKSTKAILAFSCEGPAPHPYVLDDANAGGTIHLSVKWATPKRLEASYDGHAILYSPVDKVGDVDISVRDLSSQEAKSPDGNWLATASTERYSGGDVLTDVFLQRGKGTTAPQRVLGFRSDSAAYTRSGALDLRLKWASPSRLEVTHDRCLRLDFRVAGLSGMEIALEDAGLRDLSQER